jgi:hypothetical protein
VEISEKYADRMVALKELETAGANARGAMRHVQDAAWTEAPYLAELTTREDVGDAVRRIVSTWANSERYRYDVLVREIFGNPFQNNPPRPGDAIITKLAGSIYTDSAFDRLPILADALEEAGCTDAAILEHCRAPGPHVRGCWVVDLLLGKE